MEHISARFRSSFFALGQKTTAVFILLLVSIVSLYTVRSMYLVEVPRTGGTYQEALVGTPRYINPVLAQSQTDKDISRLVYAPLLRTGIETEFVLAESLEVSEDSKEFVVTLKDDILFHDNEPITTYDVEQTIKRIQDPITASPLRPQWLGVTVEVVDEKTIIFELEESFPQFQNLLELGVMPAHIWEDINAEDFPFTVNNIQPIGSGPFYVENIVRSDTEAITQYKLGAFRSSVFNPYIESIELIIVQESQDLIDAINNGSVDGVAGIPAASIDQDIINDVTIRTYTLPRVFTLFYNRTEGEPLSSLSLRKALDTLIDKKDLVSDVLGGYGQALDGPLPSTSPYATLDTTEKTQDERRTEAQKILEDGGWEFSEETNTWSNTLDSQEVTTSLTLITPENDELVRMANRIRSTAASIGINITVNFLPSDELIENIIRPRNYEMLLFGYITDIPANIFPFWHSSGRSDPGLNIAEYGSIAVDRELNALEGETDPETIADSYKKIGDQLREDLPATFLFSQDLLYVQRDVVRHEQATNVLEYPEDRFNMVESWYVKTERLLPFLRN